MIIVGTGVEVARVTMWDEWKLSPHRSERMRVAQSATNEALAAGTDRLCRPPMTKIVALEFRHPVHLYVSHSPSNANLLSPRISPAGASRSRYVIAELRCRVRNEPSRLLVNSSTPISIITLLFLHETYALAED